MAWSLRGIDNDEHYFGAVDISNVSYFISTLVNNIIAGHYALELISTSDDGEQTCRGSVLDLAVVAGEITRTFIPLLCDAPAEPTGGVLVDAIFDDCPAEIDWLSAAPARAMVGEQIALMLVAGPDWVGVEWTADSGTFDQQNTSTTNYTCTEPGPHTISVEVIDAYVDCPPNIAEIAVECTEAL